MNYISFLWEKKTQSEYEGKKNLFAKITLNVEIFKNLQVNKNLKSHTMKDEILKSIYHLKLHMHAINTFFIYICCTWICRCDSQKDRYAIVGDLLLKSVHSCVSSCSWMKSLYLCS